jgi:hypothetical protein
MERSRGAKAGSKSDKIEQNRVKAGKRAKLVKNAEPETWSEPRRNF